MSFGATHPLKYLLRTSYPPAMFGKPMAGRNTCKKLKEKFGERMLDKSMYYRDYKDLNDYLCGKPLSQSAEPIKEKKQVQSARRMMQPPKKKGGFHL